MARDGERGRGDWKARRDSPGGDPYAEESGDSGPVDIVAVRRDDALIDAISGDGLVATDSPEEYQLATLLASWRAEIIEEPMPAGPDLDTIVAAVNQEIGARQVRVSGQRRGRLRLVRPIMGAAAALALIIGGLSAFSYNAQPGDPLWKVKEVVFSQQAQTTIAQHADDALTKAETMIQQGNFDEAKALLDNSRSNATQVNDNGRKNQLEDRWNQVWSQLDAKAPQIAVSLLPSTQTGSTPSVPDIPTTPTHPTVPGSAIPPTNLLSPGSATAPSKNPAPPSGFPILPTVIPTILPSLPTPINPLQGPPSRPTQPSTGPGDGHSQPPISEPPATHPGVPTVDQVPDPGTGPLGHQSPPVAPTIGNPGEPPQKPVTPGPPIHIPTIAPSGLPQLPGGIR